MSPRERTVLLVGALAIGAALAARGLTEARQEAAGRRSQVEALTLAIASQERVLRKLPTLEAALREIEGPGGDSLAEAFLGSRRDSDAMAELSALARRVITAGKGSVEMTEAVPDTSAGGPVRSVTLRVAFTHDLAGVLGTLRRLEDQQPLIRVSSIGVHAVEPDAGDLAPETLRVELGLRAWYRGSGKETAR